MTQTQAAKKRDKSAAPAAPAVENLSKLIDGEMPKTDYEQVKTVHLFGQFYRCNWWVVDPDPNSLFVRTGRISRSKLLRVERKDSGLKIEEIADRR